MTVQNYQPNVEKMYTYLRGYLNGAGLTQSLTALQFAREKHKDQTRKNGIPYIVHPLSMACFIAGLKIKDDNLFSTVLLHDVPEDCNVEIDNLPVNAEVKLAVKCMTIMPLKTDKSKIETKRRYFAGLLESKYAIICKALDRYNNLVDMPFALTADAIGKNAAETEVLLMPVLKEAKEKWADLADLLYVLRTIIRNINDSHKIHYNEEYEKWKKEYES